MTVGIKPGPDIDSPVSALDEIHRVTCDEDFTMRSVHVTLELPKKLPVTDMEALPDDNLDSLLTIMFGRS